MKRKWKMAIVMAVTLCSFYPLGYTRTWAAEVRTEAAEYTDQGQTILYLDKGSVELSANKVSGYNKDGRRITEVNDNGYYITATEKEADTSGKTIKISGLNNVCLGDIHIKNLDISDVDILCVSGNVTLDNVPYSFSYNVPLLQGIGENAVFDIGKEKIDSYLTEVKISNLQINAGEILAAALKLENSKIYADKVSSVEGIVFMNIGKMPGALECVGSSIFARESLEINRGQIINSTIETPEFSMDLSGNLEVSAYQNMDLNQQRVEIRNSQIKADVIGVLGITDVDVIDSEVICDRIHARTKRVNIIKKTLEGFGEDKESKQVDVGYIDDDIKIRFNNSKVTVDDPDAAIIPDEDNGGFSYWPGIDATGGTYDYETKEYISKAVCEITIENNSNVLMKQDFSMNDFVVLNIDNSTLDIQVFFPNNIDNIFIDGIYGYCSDGQKHIIINLADNVMIADGKAIEWDSCENEWDLRSVMFNGETTNIIKIIPRG